MFTHFSIEQFVPCEQSELATRVRRLPFDDLEAPVRLARKAKAVPMIKGWKLAVGGGELYIEDLVLVQRLASEGVRPSELAAGDPARLAELEQFHAWGVLETKSDAPAGGRLEIVEVPQRYFDLYRPEACTWFCMVPDKLEIDLTSLCNVNCIHCSRDAGPRAETHGELEPVELFHLVRQAAEIGVSSLMIMGGEPTVHPYFGELAWYARRCGIDSLSTSTNGLLVNDERARLMAALFGSVQVSLHGATARTHDAVVGRLGAFDKATRAVRLLKQYGASVNLSFTVMQQNRHEMPAMVELGNTLGADSIRFLGLSPEGRGACLPQLGSEDRQQISDFIRAQRAEQEQQGRAFVVEGGGFPIYMPFNDEASFYGCPAARTLMYVDASGMAGICSVVPMRIGSVRERSLLDLWHDRSIHHLRQRIQCDCPYTSACAGGCLAAQVWADKFSETGAAAVNH